MSTPLTRSQAKLWTLGAQVGSLVFVLGAVGVGMIGLPEYQPGSSLEQAKTNAAAFKAPIGNNQAGADGTDQPAGPRNASVDTAGLSQRLALLDNAPEPPAVAVEPEPAEEREPETGPTIDEATIARRVKYIGFINDARTPRAFIRIDGKQRIIAMGELARSADESLPDLEVERITPRLIILRDGDTRAAVNLASKSGASVTMVDGDDIAVAAAPDDGSLLTEEEEAYINSLPVRQRQMARRRLEREKRGLSPENEVRRPTPEPLVTIRGNAGESGQRPDVRRRDNQRGD